MMKSIHEKTSEFLKKNGNFGRDMDWDGFVASFQGEMAAGLSGEPSSLPMFPSHIEVGRKDLPINTPVAVIDAGGTNLRTALLSLNSDYGLSIGNFEKHSMPGVERTVTYEEFFSRIARYALAVAEKADHIGFCFSYPMKQDSSSEGVLQSWTKEIKAPDVLNTPICAGLKAALAKLGCSGEKRITILNDTVSTLLAGKTCNPEREYDGYLGLIMGTGLNAAYEEKNENIKKLPRAAAGHSQVINMESAMFNLSPRGPLDEAFIATTEAPSINQLEKMSSGAYLGPLWGFYLKAAAGEGLFSSPAAREVLSMETPGTAQMDLFLRNPRGPHLLGTLLSRSRGNDDDFKVCWSLADALLERASLLLSGVLSSVILWTGRGTDPLRPVCICADGSTFYKLHGYRCRTEYHLRNFLEIRNHRYFEIVSVENAPLVGAAVAGLTN